MDDDVHKDFIRAATRIGAFADTMTLAKALQAQYREGFRAGQRDGEDYVRRTEALPR